MEKPLINMKLTDIQKQVLRAGYYSQNALGRVVYPTYLASQTNTIKALVKRGLLTRADWWNNNVRVTELGMEVARTLIEGGEMLDTSNILFTPKGYTFYDEGLLDEPTREEE